MKIGYIRTSTADQNLDRQKKIMQDYCSVTIDVRQKERKRRVNTI